MSRLTPAEISLRAEGLLRTPGIQCPGTLEGKSRFQHVSDCHFAAASSHVGLG